MEEAFEEKKPSTEAQQPEQHTPPEGTFAAARSTAETDIISLISDDSSSRENRMTLHRTLPKKKWQKVLRLCRVMI